MEYSYKMLEPTKQFNSLNLGYLEEQFTPTSDDLKHGYKQFQLNSFQYYQPVLKRLFDVNTQNHNSIQLNHRYHISDLTTVFDTTTCELVNKSIFIKYSPLLDPVRYMIGRYDTESEDIRTLPTVDGAKFDKLADTNNASYVDGFFCLLSSKLMELHDFKHSIDYYGSFSAVQKKFKMNIADDYEYLNTSNYFLDNVNKFFRINRHRVSSVGNYNSRDNRDKITIMHDDGIVTDASSIDLDVTDIEVSVLDPLEEVYVQTKVSSEEHEDSSDEDTSDDEDEDTQTLLICIFDSIMVKYPGAILILHCANFQERNIDNVTHDPEDLRESSDGSILRSVHSFTMFPDNDDSFEGFPIHLGIWTSFRILENLRSKESVRQLDEDERWSVKRHVHNFLLHNFRFCDDFQYVSDLLWTSY